MASLLSYSTANSFNLSPSTFQPIPGHKNHQHSRYARCNTSSPMRDRCLIAKATDGDGEDQTVKPRSVICKDCDGNGAVLCSQCKGAGVNQVDFFNGQFKVGDACWLCGGRKEMLCGNCSGAGFVGGFMNTFDE